MSLSAEAERQQRKQEMAAAFRIFARFGYYEGVAGHISARDPEHVDHLWLNPVGVHFARVRASDMVLVNSEGEVVSGAGRANKAAYPIHSQVHAARPDAVSVVHTHSTHGKAWSALGRLLDPLTQDGCAFYDDHGLLIPNSAERHSFTSQTIAANPDGSFFIVLAREARPGNWLPVGGAGRLTLMLTMIEPKPTVAESAALLPSIRRIGCR